MISPRALRIIIELIILQVVVGDFRSALPVLLKPGGCEQVKCSTIAQRQTANPAVKSVHEMRVKPQVTSNRVMLQQRPQCKCEFKP